MDQNDLMQETSARIAQQLGQALIDLTAAHVQNAALTAQLAELQAQVAPPGKSRREPRGETK